MDMSITLYKIRSKKWFDRYCVDGVVRCASSKHILDASIIGYLGSTIEYKEKWKPSIFNKLGIVSTHPDPYIKLSSGLVIPMWAFEGWHYTPSVRLWIDPGSMMYLPDIIDWNRHGLECSLLALELIQCDFYLDDNGKVDYKIVGKSVDYRTRMDTCNIELFHEKIYNQCRPVLPMWLGMDLVEVPPVSCTSIYQKEWVHAHSDIHVYIQYISQIGNCNVYPVGESDVYFINGLLFVFVYGEFIPINHPKLKDHEIRLKHKTR